MRSIVISSGHGLKVRGASGYVDEVDEARRIVNAVDQQLRDAGATCKKFHDDVSTTQDQNLKRIVDYHNSQQRDLDVSIHLNAYSPTSKPMGVECLYVTQQTLSAEVSKQLALAMNLPNRGAKKRTDLYFLNKTAKPAILIEVCFCDSSGDTAAYQANFDEVVRVIAEVTAELPLPQPPLDLVPPPDVDPEAPVGLLWHTDIETTVFGGIYDYNNSAYPPYDFINDAVVGCALPYKFPGERDKVIVRNCANGRQTIVDIVDIGPWMINDEPYVLGSARPIAETCYQTNTKLPSGPNAGKVPTNAAGLDLTPAADAAIGLGGKGKCDWAFFAPPPTEVA